MTEKICYHVFLTPAGWSAQFDGYGSLHHFISRERAIAAARDAAKDRWEVLGRPSCVTVEEVSGEVVMDAEFGA